MRESVRIGRCCYRCCTAQGHKASTRAKVRPTLGGDNGPHDAACVFEAKQPREDGTTCSHCGRVVTLSTPPLQASLVKERRCRDCGNTSWICDTCMVPVEGLCVACRANAGKLRLNSDGAEVVKTVGSTVTPTSRGATAPASAPVTAKLNSGVKRVGEALSSVVDLPDAGADSPVVSAVVGAVELVPGVADAASQVVAGLLALADRFPLASQCGGVLKDLFALYKVSQCHTWCCELVVFARRT